MIFVRLLLPLVLFLSTTFITYAQHIVSGKIVEKNDTAIVYALVTATLEDSTRAVQFTDEDGDFALELSEDGIYKISAEYFGRIIYKDSLKVYYIR